MTGSNEEEAARWLRQAEHDLDAAKITAAAGSFDWTCFQSQQSAEKALKALLYRQGYRKILTHSVFELILEAERAGFGVGQFGREAKQLDSVYISARYPNGIAGSMTPSEYYGKEDAEECLKSAGSILREVRRFIPK